MACDNPYSIDGIAGESYYIFHRNLKLLIHVAEQPCPLPHGSLGCLPISENNGVILGCHVMIIHVRILNLTSFPLLGGDFNTKLVDG